jgi:catechol 2,3-dioxygenase-like lactoylglutathione lyase family enzyme
MRIHLASIPVDDQDHALRFYTEVLGCEKKTEIPLGEHRWLTVVSPEEPREPSLCWSRIPIRRSSRSKRRSSAMESRSRPSLSPTSPQSSNGCGCLG